MHWFLLVVVVVASAGCSVVSASPLPSSHQDSFSRQWSKSQHPSGLLSDLASYSRHGDISLQTLVRLLLALEVETPEGRGNDLYESRRAEAQEKRGTPFWQPMGGPLPVQTRFVSFGSRLEPDRTSKQEGPGGIKAMRYGRR